MDRGDVEELVVWLYERHGWDPAEPVDYRHIVRAELGDGAIIRHNLRGSPAQLFMHDGRMRIAVRPHVPGPYQAFFVLHELGHHVLERHGAGHDEGLANLFAACAMAPRPAVRALYRAHGWDLEMLAAHADSTETWAALRIAEVTGSPVVVVTRTYSFVRGAEFAFGPVEELRQHPRRQRPGLTRIPIGDARGRTAWIGDELAA